MGVRSSRPALSRPRHVACPLVCVSIHLPVPGGLPRSGCSFSDSLVLTQAFPGSRPHETTWEAPLICE